MIHHRAPFEGRGAESVIWNIAKIFANTGHEIVFFCQEPFQSSGVPSIENISFEFVETKFDHTRGQIEFFLRGPIQYKYVYDRVAPEVVYDNPSPALFPPAHFYGDATVISKVHAIYRRQAFSCKYYWPVKIGTVLGEEIYRFLSDEYFITNSVSTAERLQPLVDTKTNTIKANPIGITPESFTFDYNPDSNKVLSLSKLTTRKGIDTLLKAWEQIESRVSEAELTIAGDGPMRDELEHMTTELELSNVEFVGFVEEERKRELFAEARVYALPTLLEGFGMSNLEAMASGCAVVSTDTWGVRDYMTDGENGLLIPPEDPESLANAIVELLQNPSHGRELAQSGRETAEDYRMDESLDRELEILEGIQADI